MFRTSSLTEGSWSDWQIFAFWLCWCYGKTQSWIAMFVCDGTRQ